MLKRRKKLTQIQLQIILAQLVTTIKYLKTCKVIHRDIKLGNLFISENMDIKLGDFGLATRLDSDIQKKKTICGTPNYIAPQILQGKGHSYQVDIWSLGVIMYAGIIGKPPFQTPDVKTTYRRIRSCLYSFPQTATISQGAKNLISRIFQLDPSKRPSLDQINNSMFMNPGYAIPKTLQKSCLNFVPSKAFMDQALPKRQFMSVGKPSAQKKTFFPQKNQSEQKIIKQKKQSKQRIFASTNGFFKSSSKQFRTSQTIKLQTQTNFASMQSLPLSSKTLPQQKRQQIHVLKWVNYSQKYGLGYLLSDGSIGVHFNDLTKMILNTKLNVFDYIDSKNDKINRFNFQNYPKQKQMNKKVTLLQHFRVQLQGKSPIIQSRCQQRQTDRMVYVKKWTNSKHAIIFRLSNKIVQADFQDGTQIVLSSQKKTVVYLNKKKQRSQHPLSSALQSRNHEMVKRLKYLKQVLMHMLNGDDPRITTASRQARQSRQGKF